MAKCIRTINCIALVALILINLQGIAQNSRKKITINDSLFNKITINSGDENLVADIDYCVNKAEVTKIGEIALVKDNCLKLKICYSCCTGNKDICIVTDGKIQKDKKKIKYYRVKVYFFNSDRCEALCQQEVEFDLSSLKAKRGKTFVKLQDISYLLEIK
jgi:hypothetical protein